MSLVLTKDLTKYYGKERGIENLNFEIKRGEIFGFIGPNGAGKSTTIRVLLGLIKKTSGHAQIFGLDVDEHYPKILQSVGYLPSETYYYDKIKAVDLLKYSASFYEGNYSKRILELADILNLDLKKKIEDMSLGNRKKVGIIQGLLHNPELIILDEPTSGLDPLMQKTFFELIKEENRKGATILFSTHILSEVQKICNRVAIIKEGSIISTQKISELSKDAYKNVRITLQAESDTKAFALKGATAISTESNTIRFIFKGEISELINSLQNYQILDLEVNDPDLEDIFLHYYN